jgi:hypothetical protein
MTTHAEKIEYAKTDLAYQMNLLQSEGVLVTIKRIGKRRYQVEQNFEIVKEYKLRRSARMFVKKLTIKAISK